MASLFEKKKKGFSTQLSIILVLEIGQAYDTLYAITDDTSFILIFLKIKRDR
jgi:hypothetical protein